MHFLTVLEPAVWISSMVRVWWGLSFWLADGCLLSVFSCGRESALMSLPLLIRGPALSNQSSTLIISLILNHLLKDPPSSVVTSPYEFWGITVQSNIVQSIAGIYGSSDWKDSFQGRIWSMQQNDPGIMWERIIQGRAKCKRQDMLGGCNGWEEEKQEVGWETTGRSEYIQLLGHYKDAGFIMSKMGSCGSKYVTRCD